MTAEGNLPLRRDGGKLPKEQVTNWAKETITPEQLQKTSMVLS
jgi:hypothetical protein